MNSRKTKQPPVHGTVSPGFEPVLRQFEQNFREGRELGAACCVYYRGQCVVDLWGGWRDASTGAPWLEDTLVLVFSTTKGLAAMTLALADSRGWLDYDERVSAYWPEFAQCGKEGITVRQLLSHQAGLCAIGEPLDLATLADRDRLAAVLARQAPRWPPGARQGYHAISLGLYEGELIRRVDPQRRSLGQFFQEEIARPLGIEFYISLPASIPDERIAAIHMPGLFEMLFKRRNYRFAAAILNPRSLSWQAFYNPRPGTGIDHRDPANRGVEMPAAGGYGQVRAIARAYAAFAEGGAGLGLSPTTFEALTAPPVPPEQGWRDLVLRSEVAFSLGFHRPHGRLQFGSTPRAFGTPGLGGSIGFADPDARIGFAYAPNKMDFTQGSDPRQKKLERALYECLAGIRAS
jgi:CubicO group peptidase (beta-lactamase class C family)